MIIRRILFVIIALCMVRQSYGQQSSLLDTPIAINIKNTSAKKAVKLVTNSIDCDFSYDASLLNKTKVDLVAQSITPRNALFRIFRDSTLVITQVDQNVLIYKNTVSRPKQQKRKKKQIIGKVIDEVTLQPVPYVSVRGMTLDYFTSANKNGLFNMSYPIMDSAFFIISAIGYTPTQWMATPQNDPVTIILKPNATTLQEVIVRSVSPEVALKQSLHRIEENFPMKPSNAKAFFREVIYRDGDPFALSEASIDLYKQAYNSSKPDQVKLLKGRKLNNQFAPDTVVLKLKGSLKSCLDLDIVKNMPRFYSSQRQAYEYTYNDVLPYDGGLVYKIDFKPNDSYPNEFYRGSLYIDESTYALKSITFEIVPKYLHRAKSIFVNKKSRGTRIVFTNANYHINYQRIDSVNYLSYVRLESRFKIGKKRSFKMTSYNVQAELSINEVNLKSAVKIPSAESFYTNKVFLDQPMTYDENYWSGFSFLPLDVYLYDALKALE